VNKYSIVPGTFFNYFQQLSTFPVAVGQTAAVFNLQLSIFNFQVAVGQRPHGGGAPPPFNLFIYSVAKILTVASSLMNNHYFEQ